jgi:hypothetical protein
MKALKAQLGNMFNKYAIGVISLIVTLSLLANLYPEAIAAGDSLNASGFPLATFFTSGGIVYILIAVGLLIWAIKAFTD